MTQKAAKTFLGLIATRIPILILLPLCFTGIACSDNGVVPIDNTPAGRRDYVWTVDTLRSPMNRLESIWGSSPTDIWAVGSGGDVDTRLFHFDGTVWSNWPMPGTCDCVFGFDSNNVWMGGGDGEIYRFDGFKWERSFTYESGGIRLGTILDIWGTGSSDIYAVGVHFESYSDTSQRAFALHFDGRRWSEVFRATSYSQFGRIRAENGTA